MAKTAEERKAARLARKQRKAEQNGQGGGTATAVRNTVKLEDLDPMEKVSQSVKMPAEMKILLVEQAEQSGVSVITWARNALAEALDYTVPAEFGVKERAPSTGPAADKKAKAAGRRATIAALLAKYKAGEIQIDEGAIQAELAKQQERAAARAAAAEAEPGEADDDDDEEDEDEE